MEQIKTTPAISSKVHPAEIEVVQSSNVSVGSSASNANGEQVNTASLPKLPTNVKELQFSESNNKFVSLAIIGSLSEISSSSVNSTKDIQIKTNNLSPISDDKRSSTKMGQLLTSVKEIPNRMGSWALFFQTSLFSIPGSGGEILERLRGNLSLFYPNYAVISLILLAYCLLTSPLLLIGCAIYGIFAYQIVSRNQDVALFGQSISRNQQLIGLTACAVPLFLLLGLTGIFFWLIGASTCLISLHSVFHQALKLDQQQPTAHEAGFHGDVNVPAEENKTGGTFQVIAL